MAIVIGFSCHKPLVLLLLVIAIIKQRMDPYRRPYARPRLVNDAFSLATELFNKTLYVIGFGCQ